MVIIIIIIYLCYWRRQNTTNRDNSGSDLSHNRREKSDSLSITNINIIHSPCHSEVRHEGHQNEVEDLKDKTGRPHENTGLDNKDHTLQENVTTFI